MGAWDNLSIREKADIMKAAIRNGITTLPEIKQAYNEFAEGGNIYGNGGSKKSGGSFYQTHKARWNDYLLRHGVPAEQAARLSGFFSAQDALESGHGTSSAARQKNNFGGMQRLDKKTNKMVNISYPSVDAYMDAKWKMMRSRFGRALNAKTAQEYSDSLNNPKYHGKGYMYALYEGYRDGQPLDVARQTKHMNNYTKALMSIAGEKGFKASPVPAGSQSQEVEAPASIARPENPYLQFVPFTPFNPQAFGAPQAFVAPTREEFEIEQPLVEAANDYAYSPEQLEKEERRQGLDNLSFILGMMNGGNGSSFADTIGMLTGNIAAKGGPIHIKPENRGKFTALKERTGHSATWFKEHGTPAQKKMATFALNARHWKHGDGGNLYLFGGDDDNNPRPITTGGAGYIPPVVDDPVAQTRKYLYRHILPISDYNIKETINGALEGEFEYRKRNEPKFDYEKEYPKNTDYTTIGGTKAPLSVVDGIWADYLQIPQKDRKKFVGPTIQQSKYKPSSGGRSDVNYYALPLTGGAKSLLVKEGMGLPIGKNKVTDTLEKYGNTVFNLGDHTIGRGKDNKGDYISYYDVFDLNPFSDKYNGTDIPLLNKLNDASFGIGKPVHIYDRIYLDDYYGVPSPYRGGYYLPEVTITGRKRRGKKHGYGGHIYDGLTEDDQQMNIPFEIVGKGQLNPELNYGNITVGGRKGTLLSANYDTNLGRFKYDDGTEEDVQLARNFWANSKNNNSNSAVNKTLTEVVPQYSWDRDSYLAQQSRIDEEVGNRLPNIDRTITGLSNLWNYSKGYLKNKFNGDDSGILLNLADKNVSRIMSHTGDVETILTNDFIEHNNNMVRKKKDFINTTDTLLGDKKIPLSKISTFYGVEDGKLKAGPLDIFNDETVVVPNRAKYVGKIKEYHASTPATEAFREAVNKDIENYNNLHNYTPSLSQLINSILTFSKPKPSGTLHSNVGLDKAIDIQNYFEEKHKKLGAPESPYVITENNDTIRGYELNASPKTLFADENGNAVFVSSPRKHAKELNLYLKEHPMYPIMVDNGRYASYQTDFPNAEVYGGLNRPNNMFIIGTTKKKALGGNIYDGTTEDSQQMNIPYVGELPDVLIEGKKRNNVLRQVKEHWITNDKGEEVPTYWGYNPTSKQYEQLYKLTGDTDMENSIFSTYDNRHTFNVPQATEMRKAHEQWVKNGAYANGLDKAMLGYLGFGLSPIALPEIAAGALTPTGQTLLAGTLGGEAWEALNHGITGQSWGDNLGDVIGLDKDNYLGRTALGLTNPFYFTSPSMIYKGGAAATELGKSMWNAAKSIRNFIPTSESNMSGVRYAYDRNPELANIGTLEDYNDYLKTVFPESKVKDINYHMGPKGLQELKPSTGEVYNTNPDARGIYVTPDKSYAQKLRKYTTSRLENPSFFTYIKRNLTPGGWDKANEAFTDIYPVMVDTKNPLLTKGNWTWGIKDKKYQSLMDDYDAIVNSGPKWYQNFNSMPETIVPKTEQSLILGSDADVAGFRRFMSNPQITAENAADDVLAAASDSPFRYGIGTNDTLEQYFTRRRYSDKIHGKPTESFLDFDPATGDFVKSSERFAPDVIKGLPTHIQEDLMHNTVGRNMDAFINEGVTAEEAQAYVNRAKKAMEDVHVGRYSNYDYEKAGYDKTGGFYDDKNNFISVNEGSSFPEGHVEKHEGRHLIDYQADDAVLMPEITGSDYDADRVANLMQRAKQKQNMVLGDAYDNDFLTIPESKFADGLESYSHMSREAVTTNRDARDVLFAKHNIGKQDRLLQNKYIDKMSDDEIFDAVSKANGYGRRYIERLKAEGKLTPKKAKQFREAMKYVGAVATPVDVGLTAAGIASKTSDKK